MQTADKPQPKRSRWGLLVGLLVTALLIGSYGLWAVQYIRKSQLTQECKSAIEHNQIDHAIALVEAGADSNAPIQEGPSPPIWKLLWDKMRGKSTPPKKEVTLFAYFVRHWTTQYFISSTNISHDAEVARLSEVMLRHGANVNQKIQSRESTLWWAILADYKKTAKVLLTYGADANRLPFTTSTPLMHAAISGDLGMVHLLLMHGAAVNQKDETGTTVLMMICSEDRQLAIVQELLDHHAAPNMKDNDGTTALQRAKEFGAYKVAALLRKYGARE